MRILQIWFSNLCKRYSVKKIDENLHFLFCRTRFHRGGWDFKLQRHNGNEDVKKNNRFDNIISKTTTWHVYHTFLNISLPFLHHYEVKAPNFAFCGERKQATTKFYFSL